MRAGSCLGRMGSKHHNSGRGRGPSQEFVRGFARRIGWGRRPHRRSV